MPRTFNINSTQIRALTSKLESMHRSALPVAVRETLNQTAFDVKKVELIKETGAKFTKRSPSFFKAFSKVKKATGFNISQMQATVGMVDRKPGGGSEQAGRNMTPRQRGGRIPGRSLIPLNRSRVANNVKKRVKPANRLSNLKPDFANLVDTELNTAKKSRQRFVRSSLYAVTRFGPGALLKHRGEDGKTRIYRIQKVGSNVKTRRFFLATDPIYSFERGRSVEAGKVVPFTKNAAKRSAGKMNKFFLQQAKRQFKRLKK